MMLVISLQTDRQNRQLLKIKRDVETQNARLESLLATGTSIHRADSVDLLLEQGLAGLDAMLGRPGCGVVLTDTRRPGAVRHAAFAGRGPSTSTGRNGSTTATATRPATG